MLLLGTHLVDGDTLAGFNLSVVVSAALLIALVGIIFSAMLLVPPSLSGLISLAIYMRKSPYFIYKFAS